MSVFAHRLPRLAAAFVMALAASGAGCALSLSLDAEARSQWSRDYTLPENGTLEIRNPNGRVEITVTDDDAVSVAAELVVNATTQEAADEALKAFAIAEEVDGGRILLDSSADNGMTINMRRRVNYTVRVPRRANVTLAGSNGDVEVDGLAGRFEARYSNGQVVARDLTGQASVRTSNGAINLGFAALAPDGVECETSNGMITLHLPDTAGADLSARVTNGQISTEGLDVQVIEESRRRLDARLAGGGPDVRLSTTNGAIRVRSR